MTDKLTLNDALLGGPGLDSYHYNAAIYCVDCGQNITRKVFEEYPDGITYPEAQDSDVVPQPNFFSESEDCPQHCDECGEYLYGGKDIQDFIDENRGQLDERIRSALRDPNANLDDDDRKQWIANDEGLYHWARNEGVADI